MKKVDVYCLPRFYSVCQRGGKVLATATFAPIQADGVMLLLS